MKDQTVDEALRALAARTPAPGGGAAGALAAGAAAALVGMVASFTIGDRWIDRQQRMAALSEEAEVWRTRALELADDDARAFSAVAEAYRLPKSTDEEKDIRSESIQRAMIGAAEPPVRLAELAGRIGEATDELVETCNPNVRSDVGVAAALAEAALVSAVMNIGANLALITDDEAARRLGAALRTASDSAERARAVARRVLDAT